MGAGIYGGFGKTAGFEMNRLNHSVPETPITYDMALNPILRAKKVAKNLK